jgi:hypothetical protein
MALLEQRAPWPNEALPPAYLLAEFSNQGGEPSEALAAVERYQRIWPGGGWRGWGWSRSLLLAARANERLGRLDEARADAVRLLKVLRRADPGLPLLVEIQALRARLGQSAAPSLPH